jgi:anaerobic selenocysteine-containing dehydrogenase
MVNRRFFNLLGGATFAGGSLCGGAGIAAQSRDFGLRTSHDPLDLLNSRLILIWGRNPAWTNVHLVPILNEARRKGAPVVLVDPIATATAGLVDLHVAPRPGSDAFLALGMAKAAIESGAVDQAQVRGCSENYDGFVGLAGRVDLQQIGEVTGLSSQEIIELARLYCQRKPAAILTGWGVQRRRNGANIYRFLDALGMVTGNVGRPGGGVSHGRDEWRWFDRSVCLPHLARERREIPKPQMGWGLLGAGEPPIKVAVISGSNPVNQCPNSGLVRKGLDAVDFKVVLDMFMTDTASLADVFLPTTHFLQEQDLVGSYWHNYVMPVNVAQARLGEERRTSRFSHCLPRDWGSPQGSRLSPSTIWRSLSRRSRLRASRWRRYSRNRYARRARSTFLSRVDASPGLLRSSRLCRRWHRCRIPTATTRTTSCRLIPRTGCIPKSQGRWPRARLQST